jgi:hypothetical protein
MIMRKEHKKIEINKVYILEKMTKNQKLTEKIKKDVVEGKILEYC